LAIERMLDEVSSKTRDEIKIQCVMEKRRPFTMNEHYFIQSKSDKFTSLVNRRRAPPSARIPASLSPTASSTAKWTQSDFLTVLAAYGFPVKSFDDLARLYDPDKYEEELRVISDVLAYFKVAYKRMIDAIPMRIEQHFIHGFYEMMKDQLISELGLVGESGLKNCEMFSADNPDVRAQREHLMRQRDILIKATEILAGI